MDSGVGRRRLLKALGFVATAAGVQTGLIPARWVKPVIDVIIPSAMAQVTPTPTPIPSASVTPTPTPSSSIAASVTPTPTPSSSIPPSTTPMPTPSPSSMLSPVAVPVAPAATIGLMMTVVSALGLKALWSRVSGSSKPPTSRD